VMDTCSLACEGSVDRILLGSNRRLYDPVVHWWQSCWIWWQHEHGAEWSTKVCEDWKTDCGVFALQITFGLVPLDSFATDIHGFKTHRHMVQAEVCHRQGKWTATRKCLAR